MKGDNKKTILIEKQPNTIKSFQWIERESRSLVLAAIGFLIGFILGAAFGQDPILGIVGGTLGLILLGWKIDLSIIVLHLVDNDTEETVYYSVINRVLCVR